MTATLTTTHDAAPRTTITPTSAGDSTAITTNLLEAHRAAGRLVAELSERSEIWSDVDPIVQRLIDETEIVAHRVPSERDAAPTAGSAPAIVRAREMGQAQARLLEALDHVPSDDPILADDLGRSLIRVRALAADLAEAGR